MLRLSDFNFDLPDDLIANDPLSQRDRSRLLLANRTNQSLDDRIFSELPSILREGDLLVLNNTKVFPARLIGKASTGARIEIFLVEERRPDVWVALARPARRLKGGKIIFFADGFQGTVLEILEGGRVSIGLSADKSSVMEAIDLHGRTPLPPYIKRTNEAEGNDRERYQTVYARERGAIAAPTAGLHFTDHIFEELKENGVAIAEITLHVGYGTFEPVRVDNVSQHRVMAEEYEISQETARLLNQARSEGRRIIAVGTTTTRALESNVSDQGWFTAGKTVADLTILPGYRFHAIDGLLTNFHLPQSSLLILISTFAGREFIMEAYRHAVEERYRFYSYGDCMLIL